MRNGLEQWCLSFWPHGPTEWCKAELGLVLSPLVPMCPDWASCVGWPLCTGIKLLWPVSPLPGPACWDQDLVACATPTQPHVWDQTLGPSTAPAQSCDQVPNLACRARGSPWDWKFSSRRTVPTVPWCCQVFRPAGSPVGWMARRWGLSTSSLVH